jgi:S-DNA-T family DNA segregation ATPase FtsK/SpoIIIE
MMRRAYRHGTYPVPYPIPYEPAGLVIFTAVCTWIYRYRSELAPFTIALSAFIVAAILHGQHARWWTPITVITAITVVLLGFPHPVLRRHPAGERIARGLHRLWAACGIDRAIERAYAAVVIAALGGWLAAAVAISPAAKPLPQIGSIGSIALGIPWWFHRRRRAKVRVERLIARWPQVAEHIGMPGAQIASVVVDAWGWTARVLLKRGMTATQAIGKIPEIESGLELRPGSVRITGDPHKANRITMRVIEHDPHAQPVPWPGAPVTSVAQPAAIGVTEDGQPVNVLVLRRNILIGGIMGSGKSGVLNVLIAALAGCPDVILWGIDLKGGMELSPWAGCFEKLATTPAGAVALFRDAVAWLDDRAAHMAAEGQRVWEPAPSAPALIIVADEYAELPGQAHQFADSVARRGRAVAVNMIAATQRPTQDAMGNTAVRSQMDVRICLRVRERRDVDLIMGQGSFNAGWHPHKLTQPGAFLISSPEHQDPAPCRAYHITDDQVAAQAARCAWHRPAAGDPPQPAAQPAARWPLVPVTWPGSPGPAPSPGHDQAGPDQALWDALSAAGPDGMPAGELRRVTGMSKTTLYRRLRALAQDGRAVQTTRGNWRSAGPDADHQPATESDR